MLQISNLHLSYRNIEAVKGVTIEVRSGEFVAILGPNGAGKSTLIKAISGTLLQTSGEITLEGRSLSGVSTAERIRLGLGMIPEGRQLFSAMTVRENLIVGAYARLGFRVPASIESALEDVFAIFPRLRERQRQLAGSLSGGEAQMLAIGRALMVGPRLLVCDEPSLGLAPLMVKEVLVTLARLRDRGITILMADQNALAALRMADRAYVLETGTVVAKGESAALLADERLQAAYLGSSEVHR